MPAQPVTSPVSTPTTRWVRIEWEWGLECVFRSTGYVVQARPSDQEPTSVPGSRPETHRGVGDSGASG